MEPRRLTPDSAMRQRASPLRGRPSYIRRPVGPPSKQIQDVFVAVPQKLVAVTPHQVASPQSSPLTSAPQKPLRAAQSALPASRMHPVERSSVLRREVVPFPILNSPAPAVAAKPTKPRKRRQTTALYAMAILLLIVGLAINLNGLLANRQVTAQVGKLSAKSTAASGSSDESAPPSTVKPSAAAVSGYAVSPNLPRYIDISKLGVHARVLSMGVTSKNQLQAPGNVYDAGWYNASAQPGQPGAMLIDGHISSWTTHGVFYGLNKLVNGDSISVTRGDGKTFSYKVVKTEVEASNQVDMASLLVSQNTALPGLNLISCSGDVIPGTNEFDKRVIVYAVMQ